MAPANARSRYQSFGHADRRLGAGIAVSVLLHVLLLSLQFGLPAWDPAGSGTLTVSLIPAPSSPPAPPAPPAPPVSPAPLSTRAPASQLSAPYLPAPSPEPAPGGLRLLDPARPQPAALNAVRAKPNQRQRPRARSRPALANRLAKPVPSPVIAALPRAGSEFTVPLPDIEAGTGAGPAHAGLETGDADVPLAVPPVVPPFVLPEVPQVPDPASSGQAAPARETAELAGAESLRLAAQVEQEAQRQAHESERLAAERADQERRAREQLAFEQARQQADALRLTEERRLLQLAELQRDEKARAEKEGEEKEREEVREENELARRGDEERQRVAREEAQRLHAEEARRQLAQQLVQRQREDALRLAREQAEHRAAEDAARARTALAAPGRHEAAGAAAGAGNAAGPGAVAGAGGRAGAAPADLPGGAFGSRAREMLRGVAIPGIVAPPVPPQGPADGRRVLADGAERDVPLRLYVASVRQKLERNAVLGGARFASRELRIDPLVSLSLRSDGSVDDVTIVRSSGRPDMDEAVRRFVRLNARYSAFPPNVAARFDIIEIRRVWTFADGLKLLEELH